MIKLYPTIERDEKMNIIFHEREFNGLEYQTVLRPFWFEQNREISVPIKKLEFQKMCFDMYIDEHRLARVYVYVEGSIRSVLPIEKLSDIVENNAA